MHSSAAHELRPALPVARGVSPVCHDEAAESDELSALLHTILDTRRNHSAKNLIAPGPSESEMRQIMGAAAAAPDHGVVVPWRFVVIPLHKRDRLAEVFAAALVARDPAVTPAQLDDARAKAYRAPFLAVAIARLEDAALDDEPAGGPAGAQASLPIPATERLISLGAAIQNVLLAAHAQGYGTGLTSGKAMASPTMRALLQLTAGEEAICCINIGTAARAPRVRAAARPTVDSFLSVL